MESVLLNSFPCVAWQLPERKEMLVDLTEFIFHLSVPPAFETQQTSSTQSNLWEGTVLLKMNCVNYLLHVFSSWNFCL